ncbi:Type I polyketide synthase OS=Streptomyces rimosus subsp. rimosus (strain ATCC / DSM 40260 / JCM 4667 / NRRL 2234) OX=1265868 GN=SRIM_039140 PE=4 SV=1 [Streptomyces rimosus subsp. rimosus]
MITGFPAAAAGTATRSTTRSRAVRAQLRAARCLPGRDGRVRYRFFGCRRARRLGWTRSSASRWRWPGRRWRTAGIDPGALRGSRTGVYLGLMGNADYARGASADARGHAGPSRSATRAACVGPAGLCVRLARARASRWTRRVPRAGGMHQAAQALRAGECRSALAGGVTVLTSPTLFVEYARHGALAPDGRCRPFAAAAEGTAWGEGAGMLVMERLSDRARNGATGCSRPARLGTQLRRRVQRPDRAERIGAAAGDPGRADRRGPGAR